MNKNVEKQWLYIWLAKVMFNDLYTRKMPDGHTAHGNSLSYYALKDINNNIAHWIIIYGKITHDNDEYRILLCDLPVCIRRCGAIPCRTLLKLWMKDCVSIIQLFLYIIVGVCVCVGYYIIPLLCSSFYKAEWD